MSYDNTPRNCDTCPHARLNEPGAIAAGIPRNFTCHVAAPRFRVRGPARFPVVAGAGCGQHPSNMAMAHLLFATALEGLTNGE